MGRFLNVTIGYEMDLKLKMQHMNMLQKQSLIMEQVLKLKVRR